jgi:hypothetical protein
MQETLLCRVVLANRHLRVSPQCPLCLTELRTSNISFLSAQGRVKFGMGQLVSNAYIID